MAKSKSKETSTPNSVDHGQDHFDHNQDHLGENESSGSGSGLDIDEIVSNLNEAPNWSAKIRYLHSQGFRKSTIALILGEIRGYTMSPQHVSNVLSRPLKGTGQGPQTHPQGNGGKAGRPIEVDPRALSVIRNFQQSLRKRSEVVQLHPPTQPKTEAE
jgi:hypothetical protein